MNDKPNGSTVLIAGGSGFVGTALTQELKTRNYNVFQLVRSTPENLNQIQWNPAEGEIDSAAIESADIVVNLAGASIAGGWWTENRKKLILQSRLDVTHTLSRAIHSASKKPQVFVSTSAVGFYGDRPDEVLDESSSAGDDFLSSVCLQWEAAADLAREAGVRVVHPRLGVVMSGTGGMLPLISIPFKFGVGGRIGGDQHMAWIDLHDLVRVLMFVIENDQITGPVNAVAPESTTNADFTAAMGKALHRPTIIPIPKAVAGVVGGELARELLLADQNVTPVVLRDAGFKFERPTIASSLNYAFPKQ